MSDNFSEIVLMVIIRCGHDIFWALVPGTFIYHFDPQNEEISFLKKKNFLSRV